MHYHLLVCWRLLSCLPPSAQFLQALESSSEQPELDDVHVLHTLRWLPRLPHKAFQGWTKVSTLRQTTCGLHNNILASYWLGNVLKWDI